MSLPTASVRCPYCGEPVELLLDASGDAQRYVEDCPVCCRPMEIAVRPDAGDWQVEATRDSDA